MRSAFKYLVRKQHHSHGASKAICYSLQVNFLHSLDSLYHPSHLLASQQQFLHPSHHAGELSGHTLPNPHRNSGGISLILTVLSHSSSVVSKCVIVSRTNKVGHRKSNKEK